MHFILLSHILVACQDTEKNTSTSTIEDTVTDNDGDGFAGEEDCDDDNESINPAATETCDGIDNNCDGNIDEEVRNVYYADSDGDGFGNPEISTEACEVPSGFVENGSDCMDTDSTAYPGGEEVCDGVDNDCDEEIDEELAQIFYIDEDGDGFGNPDQAIEACLVTPGLSPLGEDCDDTNQNIHPLATEICDEIDNNCDGNVDEDVTYTFYQDSDEDGFGTTDNTVQACSMPEGYTDRDGDCDDLETYANPFAIEICDEIDNDCDGNVDESGAAGESTFYTDADGDGFGDAATEVTACAVPNGSVLVAGDCDDTTAIINPATVEICDGLDNDCDNSIDNNAVNQSVWYLDFDGDGFGDATNSVTSCDAPVDYVGVDGDCDDASSAIHPSATEICDELDNNCDNVVDTNAVDRTDWYIDVDEDGFGNNGLMVSSCEAPSGFVDDNSDCDDSNAQLNPSIIEICDGLDNDCDNSIDNNATDASPWYLDSDSDGFGDSNVVEMSCDTLTGYTENGGDCNDTDASINPDAVEQCDSVDHDCDGNADNATGGSSAICAGLSCQSILDDDPSATDGVYWLDPEGNGNSWEGYCDMTRDGGGWTKMSSALVPHLFTTSNWSEYGDPTDNNYSKMVELEHFANNGTFTLRFEVGDSGDWTSGNRAHYTVWTQDHHPAEETTNGSDYVLLDGQESTTCGGFNGFHDRHYVSGTGYSVMNDVDSTDGLGCWWMQAIPLKVYTTGGYLEGYNGTNLHVWQSFWVR